MWHIYLEGLVYPLLSKFRISFEIFAIGLSNFLENDLQSFPDVVYAKKNGSTRLNLPKDVTFILKTQAFFAVPYPEPDLRNNQFYTHEKYFVKKIQLEIVQLQFIPMICLLSYLNKYLKINRPIVFLEYVVLRC